MLIKLLPAPPHPSVLFNISFEDLPDGLPLPPTWAARLSSLIYDELPIPEYRHALDKASFLPCILEEVAFDMPSYIVTCRFIDGSVEEWRVDVGNSQPSLGAKCYQALESVVDDVCLSTLQSEREKEREKKEQEFSEERERRRSLQMPPPSLTKSSKHKKKKSLLMTIVSSLTTLNSMINLSLPSPAISPLSSTSATPLPPYSKYPPTPLPSSQKLEIPTQEMSPRFLRRRARSSLVDAFRLYVLHELNQRLPQGGFYIWALNSLLRDARERRNAVLAKERECQRQRESFRISDLPSSPRSSCASTSSSASSVSPITFGRTKPHPRHTRGPSIETETFSATTACEPPTSDDEYDEADSARCGIADSDEIDDDTDSTETETDGSSIQTPSSSHFTLPLPTSLPSVPTSRDLTLLNRTSRISPSLARSPSRSQPPIPRPHPADVQIQKLTQLILLHTSQSARTVHDECARLDALEVRGRRRAWLNRALCHNGLRLTASGGRVSTNLQRMEISMGAGHGGLGFSVPIRRSSLGMWVLTAEDVDFDPVVVQVQQKQDSTNIDSGQRDAIMLEEDEEVGDRFTGYDERNGIEPKRTHISVPSNGVQLFPVNEIEEEEDSGAPNVLSKSPDSLLFADDDDSSVKFDGLSLDQYDDLRGLQMDLDVVTGVGFDMMDSDDEDTEADATMSTVSSSDGEIPEGGICVALEIPRPKTLHARSPHLLFGKQRNQRQNVTTSSEVHPVHDYPHPDSFPPRCSSPIPPASPPPGSGQAHESVDVSPPQPQGLIPPPASTPNPTRSRSSTTITGSQTTSVSSPSVPDSCDKPFCRPSSPELDLESGMCARFTGFERRLIPQDIDVSEIGELVSRTNRMSLRGDVKEFTLAMDLPSRLLSSKFGGISFAAMGQTKAFGGRVRGALKSLGSLDGVVEETVVVEDMEKGTAWV